MRDSESEPIGPGQPLEVVYDEDGGFADGILTRAADDPDYRRQALAQTRQWAATGALPRMLPVSTAPICAQKRRLGSPGGWAPGGDTTRRAPADASRQYRPSSRPEPTSRVTRRTGTRVVDAAISPQ